MSLNEKIEDYVSCQLKSHTTSLVRAPKVIHDAILGSNLFMPHEILEAISEATNTLGSKVQEEEIWIDLQPGPNFKEAILCPIKSRGEPSGHILLHDVLPVDDWVKAFSQNKWNGYIFTKPEKRTIVYKAAKKVVNDAFEIKLNRFSGHLAKIDDVDVKEIEE